MGYQPIEQIKIGSFAFGKAWGGSIFSANMSVGYNSSPTQIIFNIVKDKNTADFSITDSDISVLTPVSILIGALSFNMFLYSYSKSRNVDSGTILTVTYTDQSINLDRVYIGLTNEHSRKGVQKLFLAATVPIVCESCDGSPVARSVPNQIIYRNVDTLGLAGSARTLGSVTYGVKEVTFLIGTTTSLGAPVQSLTLQGPVDILADAAGSNLISPVSPVLSSPFYYISSSSRVLTYNSYGPVTLPSGQLNSSYRFGNVQNGGVIVLGTEEFSQSNCATGAVSYSLKELKDAIKLFGFTISKITTPARSFETIPDGFDDLRRNYTGTLRKVLENWGSDYGFTFSYDFTKNEIIGIDLRNPFFNIELEIKNRIRGAASQSLSNVSQNSALLSKTILLENSEESSSLSGTFKKYHATIYRKDAKIRSYSKTIYNKATFTALRLADIMSLPPDFANFDQFYMACIFATMNKNLWLTYLHKVVNYFAGVLGNSTERGKLAMLLKRDPTQINLYNSATSNKLKEVVYNEIYECHKFIGTNFLNQYYVNFYYVPNSNKYCIGDSTNIEFQAKFDEDVETFYKQSGVLPNSLPSYATGMTPYLSYLYGAAGISNSFNGLGTIVNAVNILRRQGKYAQGYTPQNIDKYNQQIIPILGAGLTTPNSDFETKLNHFATNNTTNITFDLLSGFANLNEKLAVANSSSQNCSLLCEEDFVSEVCNFTRCLGPGQRIDGQWPVGLLDNQSNKATVVFSNTVPGSTANMTFHILTPSYSAYQCNFIYQFNSRYVMPGAKKVINGEVDNSSPAASDLPGNVESVDFSTADVTGDLDTYFDNTTNQVVTNVFIPKSTTANPNGQLMTVENYDSEYRNTGLATTSVSQLRKTFRFSMPGMLSSDYADILKPEKGLVSVDISFDEKGLTSTYSFSTRPPVPPQKDIVFTRISPNFVRRS